MTALIIYLIIGFSQALAFWIVADITIKQLVSLILFWPAIWLMFFMALIEKRMTWQDFVIEHNLAIKVFCGVAAFQILVMIIFFYLK